jgi:hypothetical protein
MTPGEPQAGLVGFDEAGVPAVDGMRLPALAANRMMMDDSKAESDQKRAEQAPADDGAQELAFQALKARGMRPEDAPTVRDVLKGALDADRVDQELASPDRPFPLARAPGGGYVHGVTGERLPEVDMDGPPSAARTLTAERREMPPDDPVETFRALHLDLIGYMARADYQGALARARAQGGSDYVG